MQLWHQGRSSHSSFHGGNPPQSASPIANDMPVHTAEDKHAPGEVPKEMTQEDIDRTIEEFRAAAVNAIGAGFDGVELHGANGYLLDCFLQSKSNVRTDKYGGSIENRFRFVGDVLDAVIGAIGKDKVGIRFSPNGAFNSMGSTDFREQFSYAISECGKRGIAFVHVIDGLAFGFHKLGEPFTLAEARALLPASVALIGNAGYDGPTAEAKIKAGDADLIAFGRLFLGNPDLPERLANGWPLSAPPHHQYFYTPQPDPATGYIMPTYSPTTVE